MNALSVVTGNMIVPELAGLSAADLYSTGAGMGTIANYDGTARDLTLDAAQAARASAGNSKRPLSNAQLKKLLDSRNEREVLDGLRKVTAVSTAQVNREYRGTQS